MCRTRANKSRSSIITVLVLYYQKHLKMKAININKNQLMKNNNIKRRGTCWHAYGNYHNYNGQPAYLIPLAIILEVNVSNSIYKAHAKTKIVVQ